MSFRLQAGDRAFFNGLPKSGKSNLTAAFLQGVQSFVVIDTKRHPGEWPAWAKKNGVLVTADPAAISARQEAGKGKPKEGDPPTGQLLNKRLIFQISTQAIRDRAGWYKPGRPGHLWTQALQNIRDRRRPTVVLFDEVLQSLPAHGSHPAGQELYEQGRAFGISCWAGTQLGNRMDTHVPRLAEHCFSMRIFHAKEEELLRDARGIDCSELKTLEKFHFGYHTHGMDHWEVCPPVEKVFGV